MTSPLPQAHPLQPASSKPRLHTSLRQRYGAVRAHSLALAAPLSAEDMGAQSMPDASPTKWHLGHTTWFFETFLLIPHLPGYQRFDETFGYLFNSYYEAVGPRQPRPQRGLMTRPALSQVQAYRAHVDTHMQALLAQGLADAECALVELGLNHEQQHQELILMDILHLFSCSALKPAYNPDWPRDDRGRAGRMRHHGAGLVEIGHDGEHFAFDNEGPRHKVYLAPFEISDRLVTNGQWLAFIGDGGYRQPAHWLSEGWATVQADGWQAPGYWQRVPEYPEHLAQGWLAMTLRGLEPLDPDAPVTHLSYFEAAAYASWAEARLPSEAEWELARRTGTLEQADDVAWQWTQTAYSAYPGFKPAKGAVGEYNGKFMCNQFVLRGGCQFTPAGHTRPTYRNFFPANARWARAGLRLARDSRANALHPVPSPAATDPLEGFRHDVLAGLGASPKALSPKYFYDAKGSRLFEEICTLPEYYPTRAEAALLRRIAPELSALIPDGASLVEFGSGASEKTRLLLDAAPQLGAYVPIDISADALGRACETLRRTYPHLNITPLTGDFTQPLSLPAAARERARVGFFPGSTLGNFDEEEAVAFLRAARHSLGRDACFIVGVDMVKPVELLEAAYDDRQGVTAAFNKNLLTRINRELGADFDLDAFDHNARWNPGQQRIEMHLVARSPQRVTIAGEVFIFAKGETLHTENSHKFTADKLSMLAARAGWKLTEQWLSEAPEVGMFCLR